jgi:hypothetical protein
LQTSLIGRVHYVFGFNPNSKVTLSNNFLNGETTYSTSCDGYQYWGMELVGENDSITFKGAHASNPLPFITTCFTLAF